MNNNLNRQTGLKVVFFDAAGTLFHLPQGVGYHYSEVLARHGVKREKAALAAAFRDAWSEIEPPTQSAGPRPDDDRGWWRDLVNKVLDRCHVAEDAVARGPFFEELYAEFVRPAVWRLFPEVQEVLGTLASRCALGVITNFDGRFRTIAAELDLTRHFRHIVISSEVGADKPAPLIFERALEIAGVAAGEALHAGDDPVCDWEGAERAGMHVFRLDRPRNSLRDLLEMV